MHQLGLQFLQPRFGLLPLGQIADEAGEVALLAGLHLADTELERKGRTVLAFADHHAADADDAPLAGGPVAIEIAVVTFAIGRRHQNLDVLAEHFGRAVAEQALGRDAEGLHDAALIDHDHGVRNGVENKLHVGFARERRLRTDRRRDARAAEQFAAP
jgi:hypothetical protein